MSEFIDENYNFTDAILTEVKRDGFSLDYLLSFYLYIGKDNGEILTLRLKNVKKLSINVAVRDGGDIYSPYTLSHAEKRNTDSGEELICYSDTAFYSGRENDALVYCLCDDVYVEQ